MSVVPLVGRYSNGQVIVPYERNADFVGRESVLQKLKAKFELEKPPLDRQCRKTALSGLGGIG